MRGVLWELDERGVEGSGYGLHGLGKHRLNLVTEIKPLHESEKRG